MFHIDNWFSSENITNKLTIYNNQQIKLDVIILGLNKCLHLIVCNESSWFPSEIKTDNLNCEKTQPSMNEHDNTIFISTINQWYSLWMYW